MGVIFRFIITYSPSLLPSQICWCNLLSSAVVSWQGVGVVNLSYSFITSTLMTTTIMKMMMTAPWLTSATSPATKVVCMALKRPQKSICVVSLSFFPSNGQIGQITDHHTCQMQVARKLLTCLLQKELPIIISTPAFVFLLPVCTAWQDPSHHPWMWACLNPDCHCQSHHLSQLSNLNHSYSCLMQAVIVQVMVGWWLAWHVLLSASEASLARLVSWLAWLRRWGLAVLG